MRRFIFLICLLFACHLLFAEEYEVTFERRYSNCVLQYYAPDSKGLSTILMYEKGYDSIPREWVISSYNDELLKNFLFYLVENSPTKFPNEYDLSIFKKYEKEHKELVLLEEKTKIQSNNTLTKRYSYKLELE